ncbi:MAG: type I-E CRISPR-associated protein Cas6/Cse3/CasE [Desulfobacterales bacterium]|nr:type I-E CRISPR-associated protein Cas6/Cse3/CasE [Desulfobacterales bacterium]
MFFSKIDLLPDQPENVLRLIKGGLYTEHQWMWKIFPKDDGHSRDFLYRKEDGNDWPFYYLLSARKPENTLEGIRISTKTYRPEIRPGDRFFFKLRANAVITTKTDDHSNKRRRRDIVEALVDNKKKEDIQLPGKAQLIDEAGGNWIRRQGEDNGFCVDSLNVENHRLLTLRRGSNQAPIHFGSLDFSGRLLVSEPEAFMNPLLNGLGRSKAFGCGLMLVRRV